MLRKNFFHFADMYLGLPEPVEEQIKDLDEGEEVVSIRAPWIFDCGFDKTEQFHHNTGPTLHWDEDIS
jgi:hypothetical protein